MDTQEYGIPLALLGSGIIILLMVAFMGNTANPAEFLTIQAIGLILGVGIAIGACYLTAALMNTGFGYLNTAILKLAAIFVFTSATGTLIPFGLITFPIYFGLLLWLFDLTWIEGVVFTIVLGLCRLLVVAMLVSAIAGFLSL